MRKKEKQHKIETAEEIPFVEGKWEWNVYDVDNSVLHHMDQDGTHPSMVLVEYKDKILIAELTHQEGKMKFEIDNPNTKDTKPSYMKRKTVATRNKKNSEPITIRDLKTKRNDRILTIEEKKKILENLNNKKVNRINMKVLVELEPRKKKPKK